jgi:PAS domain S-box-containing protein
MQWLSDAACPRWGGAMDFFRQLFLSGDFQPHGFCYRWNSGLVWLNVLSDTLIALAYFTIPFTLLWFIRKRRDLPFSWMFALFGVFIIACGTTHVMEVWNLWHAQYWLAGIIKAITALASILTAILLVQLVPKALALPSPGELKEVNRHLVERTKELASGNKALQHFQEQQRLLFDSIPYPVWVYESYTLAINDVNLSAIRSYGYSREEFLSLTIKDLRPAADTPALLENAKKAPEGAETAGSCKHRKKNGDLIDVEITSDTVVFEGRDARLVVATDVTERKQTEEALRQSDERLNLLVQGVKDYAILMLDPEGRVTTWNDGAERIKGYRAEEVIGQHFSIFYTPEAVAQDKPSQELKIAAEQWRFEEEGWRVRKDGTRFWANAVITALRDKTGQLRGFGKVTRDITERRQAAEEVERQRNELARSNAELIATNNELEAFSYSVSHDLRAPLRSIDGFSLALLEDYEEKLDAGGKDNLHRVRAATQRMGVLIDDLLNLSRVTRTEMKLQRVDLSAIGRSIAADLKNTRPERRSEFSVQEDLEAYADSHLMRIALENLIGNAWKFTSKRESACIEFGKTHCNGSLAYFVRDNGAGFDPARAERLFGAFQRLHDANDFPGTGVGLATVQRIIHRHGGRIWAESAVERGATFYFTLEAKQGGA